MISYKNIYYKKFYSYHWSIDYKFRIMNMINNSTI